MTAPRKPTRCIFRKKNGDRCGNEFHAYGNVTILGKPTNLALCTFHFNMMLEDPYEFRDQLTDGMEALLVGVKKI
jgi:hypothetical protein